MLTETIEVGSSNGLHARPVSGIVKRVSEAASSVTIALNGREANGASLLGILGLGAKQGDALTVVVAGDDEEAVIAELKSIIATDHDAS